MKYISAILIVLVAGVACTKPVPPQPVLSETATDDVPTICFEEGGALPVCHPADDLPWYHRKREELVMCVSDLVIRHDPSPSRINPAIKVMGRETFRCPYGNEVLTFVPDHGKPYECGGYVFVNFGNKIELIGKGDS